MTDWDFSLVPFGGRSVLQDLRITAKLTRDSGGVLHFAFEASAPGEQLLEIVWPGLVQSPQRRDGLWQSTCLELFLGPKSGSNYFEVNVSPSGDWNAYAFTSYREGMKPVVEVTSVSARQSADGFSRVRSLNGSVDLASLGLRSEKLGDIVLGVTAVVEYQGGQKEYWALAHAGEKPDFHLRQSFTASI